jgi:septum site-determining protein MinD
VAWARRGPLPPSALCSRKRDQNVAVIDFDVGLRNLDLVMGAEHRVVFDLINVVQGAATLS